MPRIDAHLHVFTKASAEFPREISDVWPAEREEPVEKLLDEMEKTPDRSGGSCPDGRCEHRESPLLTALSQSVSKPLFRDWIGPRGTSEPC